MPLVGPARASGVSAPGEPPVQPMRRRRSATAWTADSAPGPPAHHAPMPQHGRPGCADAVEDHRERWVTGTARPGAWPRGRRRLGGSTGDQPPRLPTAADIETAAGRIAGVVARTPLEPSLRLSALTGDDRAAQARGPAAGPLVQAARCLQPDGAAHPGRAGGRGGVCVGRQPRPGRRVRLSGAGHRRPDLPAAHDAPAEARPDPCARRRSGRADRWSATPTTTPPRRPPRTQRAPVRCRCRRSTTRGPSPARARSPPRSSSSSSTRRTWWSCPVGGGGLFAGIVALPRRARAPRSG